MKTINPENTFKVYWNLFILALTLACTFILPLAIVFDFESAVMMKVFDIVITIFFSIDIFINFNTAYEKKHTLITNKKDIKQHYLKGWFAWDLIATIPFAIIFMGISSLLLLRFFRMLRLLRLIKLFSSNKLFRRLNATKSSINPGVIRMLFMVFWILIASHLVACVFIGIGGVSISDSMLTTYLQSFYWTITTLTTIGYGDITPDITKNAQLFFTIITQLLGAGMYGFIIGNISNIIANIDVAKGAHKEKVERINSFLKYKNISPELQKRVNNYYDYLWETRRGYNEESVVDEFPVSLKTQISLQMNKDLISKVPIFKEAPDSFLKEVILNLKPVIYTPGDYIMIAGEVGYEMYFISRGKVDVMNEDESVTYVTLGEGAYIGEMALLLSTPRTATLKAIEYCDLYMLTKDMVDKILPRYPEIAKTMSKEAKRRQKEQKENLKKDTESKKTLD